MVGILSNLTNLWDVKMTEKNTQKTAIKFVPAQTKWMNIFSKCSGLLTSGWRCPFVNDIRMGENVETTSGKWGGCSGTAKK